MNLHRLRKERKVLSIWNRIASLGLLTFLIWQVESTLTVCVAIVGLLIVKYGAMVEGLLKGYVDGKEDR